MVYFRKKQKPVAEPDGDDDDGSDDDADTDEQGGQVTDGAEPDAAGEDLTNDENAVNTAESEEENVLEGKDDSIETGV